MGIPSSLRAGDTWTWTESVPDYPASAGWSLAYSLLPVSGTGSKITVNASSSGADYSVTVTAATTAAYQDGDYACLARVTKGAEVHTVEDLAGQITVLPNLAAATAYDSRTSAAKALEKIDAWLSGDRSLEVALTMIADREIRYHSLPDLLTLRDALRREVASQKAAAAMASGLPDPRNVFVRFGPP